MESNEWHGWEAEVEKPLSSSKTNGSANTPRKRGRPAKSKVTSESVAETSPTNISAKDTETQDDPSILPSDILFVSDTESNSPESTAWTLSLSGFVNSGYPTITAEQLTSLKPLVARKLRFLSKSKGTTIPETINQIALFLSDQRAAWLEDEPLPVALEFYCDNFIICTPKDLEE